MATTRRGDFTHKEYLYKIYDNGFNHKRRDYIKAEGVSYMSWATEGLNYKVGNAFVEFEDGIDSGYHYVTITGNGDSNIGLSDDASALSDPTRLANIVSSDLKFKHDYAEDTSGLVNEYYIQVFDYKIVFDIDGGTVEAFYDNVSLDSDTLSSSYDYIRMYEDEGTFYIENSSDGSSWASFASNTIDFDTDILKSQLIFNVEFGIGGAFTASATLSEIEWLRKDYGFKGILNDVDDELEFTENLNQPATSTTIKIKQNPVTMPEYIKNGAFIDIYANYWGYISYGQSGTILDHDELPILDHNSQQITGQYTSDLTPEQDSWLRFSGYIESIDSDYDTEEITITLVSHGEELANILAVNDQTQIVNVISQETQNATESVTGSYTKRQTFTLEKTQKLSGVSLRIQSGAGTDYPTITIGTGTTDIATAQARCSSSMAVVDFWFTSDLILEAGIYWVRITQAASTITWSYQNTGNPYDGGSRQTLSGGVWSDNANTDAYFVLFLESPDITLQYNQEIIPDIADDLFEGSGSLVEANGLLRRVGSQITSGQVDDVGYNISLFLKMNTVKEALDKIYGQTTLGWWWRIDTGTSEFTLQEQASTPDHIFYVGEDILQLKIKRSIADLKNIVYFVGGTLNQEQDTLTIVSQDIDSIAGYRRGLSVLSDGRVFRYDTAQAFSDFEIAQNNGELITTEITIQAGTYDIETIRVGHMVRIVNLGGSSITLQIASINYRPLSVTLSLANVPTTLLKNLSTTQRQLDNLLTLESDNAI